MSSVNGYASRIRVSFRRPSNVVLTVLLMSRANQQIPWSSLVVQLLEISSDELLQVLSVMTSRVVGVETLALKGEPLVREGQCLEFVLERGYPGHLESVCRVLWNCCGDRSPVTIPGVTLAPHMNNNLVVNNANCQLCDATSFG